jgi:teichoic acid transport system permease protein
MGILSTLSFPRIALPLSVVLRQLIDFLPQLAILVPILLLLGEQISWSWLLIVPVILLLVLLNAGVAIIFARLAIQLRDITNFFPFMTRILFYTSGVFFELERILGNYPELLGIAQLNPVYVLLKLARGVLLLDGQVPADLWITASIWSLATFVVGVVFFWRAEASYGKS